MTRHTPWLLEAVPQVFVEMSQELAAEKGIRAGTLVRVSSKRGSVTAVAMPTRRLRPLKVRGKLVHQVGLPWCFGWITPNAGDSANLLTPNIGDASASTPETKTFLVNVEKISAGSSPVLSQLGQWRI